MDGRGAGGDLIDPATLSEVPDGTWPRKAPGGGGNRFLSGSVRQSHGYGFPARRLFTPGARTMSHPDDDATQPQPPHAPSIRRPRRRTSRCTHRLRRRRRLPPAPPANIPPYAAAPPPPGGAATRAAVRHRRESRHRALTALAVACFLVAAALVGYTMGANNGWLRPRSAASRPCSSRSPTSPDSSSSNGQQSNIDVDGIAAKVSPSIVNLTSTLAQGEAAGTGIIVSSSGLVLTNNHVIAYSNDLQAEIGGDGEQHPVDGARLRHRERRRAGADRGRVGPHRRVARELVRPADRRRDRRPRQRRAAGAAHPAW